MKWSIEVISYANIMILLSNKASIEIAFWKSKRPLYKITTAKIK
jgi:hypothetical protein